METERATTETWNGAQSLATTGQARVDYFSKAIRDTPRETIHSMLEKCWEESPLDTLKLIFYKRDCRGGAGEKQVFYDSMEWLIRKHYIEFALVYKYIPEYGCWRDLVVLMDRNQSTLAYVQLLDHYARQLQQDHADFCAGKSISLAAKWAPSEHKQYDAVARALAAQIYPSLTNTMRTYRSQLLSPLRQYINIVERLMCGKQWDQINFSQVPSRAMFKLRKAFEKHEPTRFEEWQSMVADGKAKINSGQVDPPEIVKSLMEQSDTTLELAWAETLNSVLNSAREYGQLHNALVVCDVSGSMFHGTGKSSIRPIHVSLAFGLMVAELSKGRFHNKIITFHDSPNFFKITGSSCREKIQSLEKAPWGMSTNFQSVFELLLNTATTFDLTSDQMPTRIICISDMQFNEASGNRQTNWEAVKQMYGRAGYRLPELVFWNVNGTTGDFPVQHNEEGVALVAGYNKAILKSVMTGEVVSPYQIMRETIDAPRYQQIKLEYRCDPIEY